MIALLGTFNRETALVGAFSGQCKFREASLTALIVTSTISGREAELPVPNRWSKLFNCWTVPTQSTARFVFSATRSRGCFRESDGIFIRVLQFWHRIYTVMCNAFSSFVESVFKHLVNTIYSSILHLTLHWGICKVLKYVQWQTDISFMDFGTKLVIIEDFVFCVLTCRQHGEYWILTILKNPNFYVEH